MIFTGATFGKIKSCLVARIVSFDTTGLHLLTFRILEPCSSKDIELDLNHVKSHYNDINILPSNKSYLSQCFQLSQLLNYDSDIVITQIIQITQWAPPDFSNLEFLTRGFIALICAFNLANRAFNLVTRAFIPLTRRFELVTRGLELVTRGFELVTCRFEL